MTRLFQEESKRVGLNDRIAVDKHDPVAVCGAGSKISRRGEAAALIRHHCCAKQARECTSVIGRPAVDDDDFGGPRGLQSPETAKNHCGAVSRGNHRTDGDRVFGWRDHQPPAATPLWARSTLSSGRLTWPDYSLVGERGSDVTRPPPAQFQWCACTPLSPATCTGAMKLVAVFMALSSFVPGGA